jgi:hypothetical protein
MEVVTAKQLQQGRSLRGRRSGLLVPVALQAELIDVTLGPMSVEGCRIRLI